MNIMDACLSLPTTSKILKSKKKKNTREAMQVLKEGIRNPISSPNFAQITFPLVGSRKYAYPCQGWFFGLDPPTPPPGIFSLLHTFL